MKWQVQFKVINAKLKQEQQQRKKKCLVNLPKVKFKRLLRRFLLILDKSVDDMIQTLML